MNAKELDYVRETIDCEGFESAFVDYSDFTDVDDAEFHRLRKAYLASRDALASYLNV